jgi:hypothetical protein
MMWIIVQSDMEDSGMNVLMDDEGGAIKFKDKVSAYRYIEHLCKEHGVDYELMENDIELWRLH